MPSAVGAEPEVISRSLPSACPSSFNILASSFSMVLFSSSVSDDMIVGIGPAGN